MPTIKALFRMLMCDRSRLRELLRGAAGATRKATPANRLLELDAGFVDHVEPGVHLAVDHLGELLRRTADEWVEMREFGDDLRIIIDFVYGRVQLTDDGLGCSGPGSY